MVIRLSSGMTSGYGCEILHFLLHLLYFTGGNGFEALNLKHELSQIWLTPIFATLGPTHHIYFRFISPLFALLLIIGECTDNIIFQRLHDSLSTL